MVVHPDAGRPGRIVTLEAAEHDEDAARRHGLVTGQEAGAAAAGHEQREVLASR